MASIVGDEPCPQCRERGGDKTGNHLILFDDGNKYCNRCHYFVSADGTLTRERDDDDMHLTFEQAQDLPVFGIPHKGIKEKACEHFGIRTEFSGQGDVASTLYPHYTDGKLDGYKTKTPDKKFSAVGSIRGGELFGQSVSHTGGKFVVITEGEDDAASVWQCLVDNSDMEGWSPAVVSLTHGASSAVKDVAANLEFLNAFDRVIICFDEDEAGRAAVDAVCPLIGGQVYVTKLTEKDANDMLMAGKSDDLKWAVISQAKKYQPDGIIDGADTWERYKHSSNVQCIPYPYTKLTEMTYGFRPGSIVTITSGTGVGKTQFMRELKYHVFQATDWNVADIALEEDVGDSVSGLMSLHMGRRLHLPDVQVPEDHERKVHEELSGSPSMTTSEEWTMHLYSPSLDTLGLPDTEQFSSTTSALSYLSMLLKAENANVLIP